ncbi:piRNA biogenesis protein EXD1 [Nematolebias whitei]|uniref:piRNA biogenesis protein EXD1 n=1 Tax=Nematolebias whitei TaxID=451745 RepID=UPI001899B8C5|nr:piRNA biogenesis protein EXD1 [Nematolebias whitei]
MVVDDAHFMTLLKGKRIKLTLKSSSFMGVVQRINPNKTLVLADVSDINGRKIPGTKLFFGHEILNVEFTDEASADPGDFDLCASEGRLNVEKCQPYRKILALDDEDEAEDDAINFVVIDEFHQKFGPAVAHIKKQHVIGVAGEGVEIYKNGRLCWLQIATKCKVYLFDILLLGPRAFKNGLSMILESKHILKVIHDCRAIAGSLFAQFGVKLSNIFDTQVADVMCFYSETGGFLPDKVSTLQGVVSLHLKVSSSRLSSLQIKSQLTKEEMEMWYKRPCPVPLLKVMALSVIHLQPLRMVLLDTLMNDYKTLVDSYLNNTHYEPDGLEPITMEHVLELPKELKQLDEMRLERREWARRHYPVTECGLLARSNPNPGSESQTSRAVEDHSSTLTDTSEPTAADPTSSPQSEPLFNQQTTCTSGMTSMPSIAPAESLSPATMSNIAEDTPPSEVVDKGFTGVQMNVMGRGWVYGKEESSLPVLPSIGRGFLLKRPLSQDPKESAGDLTSLGRLEMAPRATSQVLPLEEKTPPGFHDDELSKDKCSAAQPSLSSLIQSFRN